MVARPAVLDGSPSALMKNRRFAAGFKRVKHVLAEWKSVFIGVFYNPLEGWHVRRCAQGSGERARLSALGST
jgi:hypothetical protein